jgi:hypothetical protein
MALLTPQLVNQTGPTATFTAVNASDTFIPGDRFFLDIKTTGTTITVTVGSAAPRSCALGHSFARVHARIG